MRRDFSDDLFPLPPSPRVCDVYTRAEISASTHTRGEGGGRTRGGRGKVRPEGNVCRLVGAVLIAASDENGGHPDPLPPRLVYSYLTFPFLSFP